MTGVNLDGIHGAPYIAAPWIRHGTSIPPAEKLLGSGLSKPSAVSQGS